MTFYQHVPFFCAIRILCTLHLGETLQWKKVDHNKPGKRYVFLIRKFCLCSILGLQWIYHSCDEPVEGTIKNTAHFPQGNRANGEYHPPQVQCNSDAAQTEHMWGCDDLEVKVLGCKVKWQTVSCFEYNYLSFLKIIFTNKLNCINPGLWGRHPV